MGLYQRVLASYCGDGFEFHKHRISRLILMVSILPDIVESVAGPAAVRTFREYLHNNNNRLLGLCMSLLISKKLRGAATIFRYDDEPLSAAQRFFFFR